MDLSSGTLSGLLKAIVRLTGVSKVELLDISFYGGRCYATMSAAAVPSFVRRSAGEFSMLLLQSLRPTKNS